VNPNNIELTSVDRQFQYEKYSRIIDDLPLDDLRIVAKLYFKLYLKQQETISILPQIDL
jgi:hypothetical protein